MTDADRPVFLQAIARLAVAQREPEPDLLQIRTNFEALQDCEIEFVVAAADRLIANSAWFPKANEWRQMARKIERERVEAQKTRLRKLPVPLCGECHDTGWRQSDDANSFAQCACLTQRRLEVLGRVPPSLPAAGGGEERSTLTCRNEIITLKHERNNVESEQAS